MKLCPKRKLPELNEHDVFNALSHDRKMYICTTCGKIESLEKMGAVDVAEGLKIGQRRSQVALYGLDRKGNPKLPRRLNET